MVSVRSFEFVEGTSAKFWEISQDGVDVTVRFGRVDTNGQTKVKSFGTASDAADHQAKLIAEKVRKGYHETTAGAPAAAPTPVAPAAAPAAVASAAAPAAAGPVGLTDPVGPADPTDSADPGNPADPADPGGPADPGDPGDPADEDVLVLPAAWNRFRAARRGSPGVSPVTPDPGARATVDSLTGKLPGYIAKVLAHPGTEPALARGGTAWLAGDSSAPAAGAAAVAAAAGPGNWDRAERHVAFADVWLAERGPAFAAEAAAELMALTLAEPGSRSRSSSAEPPVLRHLSVGEDRSAWRADAAMLVVMRVRTALAAASGTDYAAAVAVLAERRRDGAYQRLAASVLAPTETAWVEQDCADAAADGDQYRAALLLAAVGTPEQAAVVAPVAYAYLVIGSMPLLTTLLDGIGPAAAAHLFAWLDHDWSDADARRRLLSLVAVIASDEAMAGLIERVDGKYVQPALLDAASRFPVRALRLLAASDARRAVPDLLRAHVLAHSGVVRRTLPRLPAVAAARVRAIVDTAAAVVEAPAEAVPPLLLDPPWNRRKRAAAPVVIAGLTCTDEPAMSWRPGERDAWLATRGYHDSADDTDFRAIAARVRAGRHRWNELGVLFARGPEPLVLPLLREWHYGDVWYVDSWMRVVAARFGTDALPAVLGLARSNAADMAEIVQPFEAPELAVVVADWLARLKKSRRAALAWLNRHPAAAARALVPPALGPAGTPRRQAEQALLALAGHGHADEVRAAAKAYGAEAAEAIDVLLATDPLSVLPVRIPPVPAWATPGLLPPVVLRDGAGALPAAAIVNLVTVLSLSRPGEPYAGVAVVREACEPQSLAEFGWGMFLRWQATGGAAKESWVLETLALIGDDETVRRLTPLILLWPGEGGHQRAVTGVHVLAEIGSDVALMHLHGIAQRAKFKGLKAAANQKMTEVADGLGLTAEQLADRLVPDFGLAADGSLTLDYGPRQFTVGFDEQLRPYVADAAGKRLKALPKPGARDDETSATAAYQQFAALKKDVRTVAADQIRRLERAMVTGRRWSGAEFERLFVAHPLVWHIVRRLVWGVYSGAELVGSVRVAEDRTFADAHDEPVTLAADATVGVAHPLHLGAALAHWAELFADYEILQPFPQLGRETFALSAAEASATELVRFRDIEVPTGRVIGLERRGWLRETPQDAGHQGHIALSLRPDLEVVVELDPGVAVGALDIFPQQKLTEIWLNDGSGDYWRKKSRRPLGELDAVAASEILRDLTEVTS